MHRVNYMTRKEFLMDSLEFSGALFLFYSPLCLWRLFEDGHLVFPMILIGLLLINFPIAAFSGYKQLRFSTIISNSLISYGVLTSILFISKATMLIIVISGIAISLTVLYMVFHNLKEKRPNPKPQKVIRKTVKTFRKFYTAGSLVLIIIIVIELFNGNFSTISEDDGHIALYSSVNEHKTEEYIIENDKKTEIQTIACNYEKLKVLIEWNEHSIDERIDALQVIADVIKDELCLTKRLDVKLALMDSPTVDAYYVDEVHTIYINVDKIYNEYPENECKKAELDMIETVIHEAFHSFQYQIVNMIPEETRDILNMPIVDIYEKELDHYIDGGEDYEAYRSQHIEMDSSEYAKRRAQEIYEELKALHNKKA